MVNRVLLKLADNDYARETIKGVCALLKEAGESDPAIRKAVCGEVHSCHETCVKVFAACGKKFDPRSGKIPAEVEVRCVERHQTHPLVVDMHVLVSALAKR